MAKILEMPKLSPTMEEGVFAVWHKHEGDEVAVDDLLAEVETDKATMEFRAFDKGTLLKTLVAEGATVKLGQPVAILGQKGEDIGALIAQAGAAMPSAQAPAPAPAPVKEKAAESQTPATLAPPPQPPLAATVAPPAARRKKPDPLTRTEWDEEVEAGQAGPVLASPFVRSKARELGLDLTSIQGTGKYGRVIPDDLSQTGARARTQSNENGNGARAAAHDGQSAALVAPSRLSAPRVVPLSPMRKTIAKRLVESKRNVPHFYLTIDVRAEALVKLRESINAELAREKQKDSAAPPKKISVNDLLIKAVATALVRVPECNAQFSDEGLVFHSRVDISVAVAVPDGLVTPVVRDADKKSVVGIADEVRDLAARARQKKLKPEEMADGTFSISNLGMFGIDEFSAVINPPEGAILAIGQVRDEPVVEDGQVVAGKRLAMTLSCDHRVIDGAVGASFLAELRALLEHPMRVLTG
jgi:pyruvate dehydrogenase E2 component (dihydrolipoamide acetyltransferase)